MPPQTQSSVHGDLPLVQGIPPRLEARRGTGDAHCTRQYWMHSRHPEVSEVAVEVGQSHLGGAAASVHFPQSSEYDEGLAGRLVSTMYAPDTRLSLPRASCDRNGSIARQPMRSSHRTDRCWHCAI